jgi:SecD/SecF fusion protein
MPNNIQTIVFFIVGVLTVALFVWYFATESNKRKLGVGTVLSLLLAGLSAVIMSLQEVKKGIDLAGGVAYKVSLQADPATGKQPSKADAEAAKEILERRLSPLGNKDVVITVEGESNLYVEVPGISSEEAAKTTEIIQKVAKLDFRLVHDQSASLIGSREAGEKVREPGWVELVDRQKAEPKVDPKDPVAVAKDKQAKEEAAIANRGKSAEQQNAERLEKALKDRNTIVVQARPELSGKSVKETSVKPQPGSTYYMISVTLQGDFGDKMRKITKANLKKPMAIVVDNEVISAPIIQNEFGANFDITGNFSAEEAFELANSLENPLEVPLKMDSQSMTGSTYGKDLIRQGFIACIAGLIGMAIFMVIYYRLAGLVAILGIGVNLLLLIAAMNLFGFTLTMPGVAGIILTLGIAVDANVLIYERMREEFAQGRNLDDAIDASYNKAFSAIFDSNLTSIITSVIMILVATGAIKGFGVTLTIGILCSLFSSLLITRVCFRWLQKLGLKKLSFMSLIRNRLIDFLSLRKICYTLSAVLLSTSLAILFIKGGKSLGYELRGGDKVTLGDITPAQVKEALTGVNGKNGQQLSFNLQESTPVGSTAVELNLRTEFEDGKTALNAIKAKFPNVKAQDVQQAGPVLGGNMLKTSIWAILLGLVGIFIYLVFRYETPFAIGGLVAIVHDVAIAAGFGVLFGKEIGLIAIGALLTVAGYSINDTIVIFDRIRETLKTSTASLVDVINESVSATLSRTLITSGVTLVVVLCMLFFGGATMADFSAFMAIGMISGTYSTIFVASPVVLWWASKRKLNLQQAIQDAELLKSTIHSGIEREAPESAAS